MMGYATVVIAIIMVVVMVGVGAYLQYCMKVGEL